MPVPRSTAIRDYLGIAPNLRHEIGRSLKNSWIVSTLNGNKKRYLSYGPYETLPVGYKRVQFYLSRQDFPAEIERRPVVTLDVYDPRNKKSVAKRDIWEEELGDDQRHFSLVFEAQAKLPYEFRVFWHGGSGIRMHRIRVFEADYGPWGDLWSKNVSFKKTGAKVPRAGWHVVQDGVWYYYSRGGIVGSTPSFCKAATSVIVQKSVDKGITWSAPQTIIHPTLNGSDEDGCMILDGTTFYNDHTSKWMILAQCQGAFGAQGWQMCLYESDALDQAFTRVSVGGAKVTIKPKQLWSMICAGSNKSCLADRVYDEGTPEYLGKNGAHFYFSFHGYDGVNGYRGAARTQDFIHWESSGPLLPGDAMFTKSDCQLDNPGCIGAGHSVSLRSGDFLYQLWEAPTVNLACTKGQHWPLLLSRSFQLEASGKWTHHPGGPFIRPKYPEDETACSLQYPRFIVDGSDLYIYFIHFEYVNGVRTASQELLKLELTTEPVALPVEY